MTQEVSKTLQFTEAEWQRVEKIFNAAQREGQEQTRSLHGWMKGVVMAAVVAGEEDETLEKGTK